jgi:hypothetical protein
MTSREATPSLGAMRGRAGLIGGGLVALSALLGSCVLWFVLDPLKYALIAAQRQSMPTAAAAKAALLGLPAGAWALIAAAVLAAAATVFMEFRSRALSAAVAGCSRLGTALALGGLLLWFGHAYLYGGHLLGGDTGAHVARVAHFAAGFEQGELRYWDNAFYGGATLLQFTGPMFFWGTGTLAWLMNDPVVATKLMLLALHFAGGWGAYRLLRGYALPSAAAGVGAIVYAGAFAHLHLILYKGALPQALTLALLPLAFLAVDRLAVAPRHVGPAWAATALAVAALVATHQPHGLVAGLYLAAYVLANLAGRRYPPAALLRCVTAAVTAGLMASFAVVPWLVEGDAVAGGGAASPVFWEWPDAGYFVKLLLWNNSWTSQGAPSVAYVGATSAALTVIAVLAAFGRQARETRLVVAILAGLLLVSFGLRGDFLRDIVFTLFFAALLAGFGAGSLMAWRGATERLALLVMLLVVLDLGATAVQPLARRDKDYLDRAGGYLAAASPPRRVVLTNDYAAPGDLTRLMVEVGPSAGPISYHPVQTLSGPHNMAATLFHNYAVAVLKRVETELRGGALSPDTAGLLAMLNVGWIANDNGTGMGLPPGVAGTDAEAPLGAVLPIAGATPAVFASRLVEIVPPPGADKPALWDSSFATGADAQAREVGAVLDAVVAAMRFAPATATAAALPVRVSAAAAAPPAGIAAPAAPFAVLDHIVEAQRVEMRLLLPEAGFVQLAHPWYLFHSVTVDGQAVTPLRGTLNLLVLPLAAGEHVVEVAAERSPLRRGFGIGCGLLFLAVLAVAVWPRRRGAP